MAKLKVQPSLIAPFDAFVAAYSRTLLDLLSAIYFPTSIVSVYFGGTSPSLVGNVG